MLCPISEVSEAGPSSNLPSPLVIMDRALFQKDRAVHPYCITSLSYHSPAPVVSSCSLLHFRKHGRFRLLDIRLRMVLVAKIEMNSLGSLLRFLDDLDRLELDLVILVILEAVEGALRVRLGEYLPGLVAYDREICQQATSALRGPMVDDEMGHPPSQLGHIPSSAFPSRRRR